MIVRQASSMADAVRNRPSARTRSRLSSYRLSFSIFFFIFIFISLTPRSVKTDGIGARMAVPQLNKV